MCDSRPLTHVSDFIGSHEARRSSVSTVFPGHPRVLVDSLFNVEIVIRDIRWLRADPDKAGFYLGGRPVFAVLLCESYDFPEGARVTLKGSRRLFTTHTGSVKVCRTLYDLQLGDHLPAVGRIIKLNDDSYDLV